MTYQKIKETVVNEHKIMTTKQLRWFMVKLVLFIFGASMTLALPAGTLLGARVSLIVFILAFLLFNTLVSLIVEDKDSFKRVNIAAKLWWLPYILFVVVFIVLKFFNFM